MSYTPFHFRFLVLFICCLYAGDLLPNTLSFLTGIRLWWNLLLSMTETGSEVCIGMKACSCHEIKESDIKLLFPFLFFHQVTFALIDSLTDDFWEVKWIFLFFLFPVERKRDTRLCETRFTSLFLFERLRHSRKKKFSF